jgi:hypothetical protein
MGRGALKLANRAADGSPGALTDVGENVVFSVEITKEYKENYSSRYAISEKDAHVPIRQALKVMLTIKEAVAKNLEIILHGKSTTYAGGTVTGAAFPSGIQAGETYELPGLQGAPSALTIVDSTGSPVTLVAGTDYVADLQFGTVKFNSSALAGKIQPFKASYTQAGATRTSILAQEVPDKYLRFEGINIANNDGPRNFLAVIYNAKLLPAKKVDFKGEDYAQFEIECECLIDPNKAEDPELGRYGYYLPFS